MCNNRTFETGNITLASPIHECIPIPTLVNDVKIRPGPSVTVDPSESLHGDVRVAHNDLPEKINTVVGVFELFLHGMFIGIVFPVNLFTDDVEAVQLMKSIYSHQIPSGSIIERN